MVPASRACASVRVTLPSTFGARKSWTFAIAMPVPRFGLSIM